VNCFTPPTGSRPTATSPDAASRPPAAACSTASRRRNVAVAVGIHDQAHLHRHFTRLVGTTPGRYARSLPARAEKRHGAFACRGWPDRAPVTR
jgi:hypothetical protein